MLTAHPTRHYCFGCGAPVAELRDRPAALCSRCAVAGPHLPLDGLRWMVRSLAGRSLGPLSHDAVADQIRRKAIGPADLICRVGDSWAEVVEHPDFRAWFLPGSALAAEREVAQATERRDRALFQAGKVARVAAAAALMVGGVGAAIYSTTNRLLVMPEAWTDAASEAFDEVHSVVSGEIEQATSQEAADRSVKAAAERPGKALVDALRAANPNLEGPASLRFQRGRVALWKGTLADLEVARVEMEAAFALAPDDVEIAAGLCETYANVSRRNADYIDGMVQACARADSIDADAVSSVRARSAANRASGKEAAGEDLARQCGDPPELAGTAGTTVDLGCAITLARATNNLAALNTLEQRSPASFRLQLARAQVALATGDHSLAIESAQRLTKRHPTEPVPWRILEEAYANVGEWSGAEAAGMRVKQLDPDDLEGRRLLAEVQLKVFGKARAAHDELVSISNHPNFGRSRTQARVFTDAAAAALEMGDANQALTLAQRALQLDPGNPAACLYRAKALLGVNRTSDAETAIHDVDAQRTVGRSGARFHLGAARLFMSLDRERAAEAAIESALELDPQFLAAWFEGVNAKLAIGDPPGALKLVRGLAFLDIRRDADRSPLQELWYPEPSYRSLRDELEKQLTGDVRLAAGGAEAVAIMAWATGMSDGLRLLEKVNAANPDLPAVHAALASAYFANGSYKEAISHADQVLSGEESPAVPIAMRARSLEALGQTEQADAAFNEAAQAGPNTPGIYRWRAEMLLARGDKAGFARELSEVLRLSPDDIGARKALMGAR